VELGLLDFDAARRSSDLRSGPDKNPISLFQDLLRLGALLVEYSMSPRL